MRFPRIKPDIHSFYHCISRVVEGRFIFAICEGRSCEAEKFIALMRRLEAFCGVHVREYVIMANHFHLLCEVPEPRLLSQSEVLERIQAGYGPQRVRALQEQLARFSEQPDGVELCKRLLDPYRKRMNDISIFIKELKGRFASGLIAATAATAHCGLSASRVYCSKTGRRWRRLPPTSI